MRRKSWSVFSGVILGSCLICSAHAQTTQETVTLSPIVVSATRVETPEEEIGKSVVVITAEELAQQKAASLTNALRGLLGIQVKQLGGPGAQQTISIRGLSAMYTQILVDGLPVRDPSETQGSAIEFMDNILLENIERIEITRGTSSTLYGSHAIGGTINIVTKKGEEKPEYFGAFEGGSMATFQESLGLRGRADKISYALTAKRTDSNGLDDHGDYSATSAAGQFGVDFSDAIALKLHLHYADSTLDLNDSPSFADNAIVADQDDPDDQKDKTQMIGGAALTHQVSDAFDYAVKFGYVISERTFEFGAEGDESGYASEAEYNGHTLTAEAQGNYWIHEAHLLTAGYTYEYEQFEQDLDGEREEPDAVRHALYAQDSATFFGDALTLTPGVRYQHHDQAGDRVDWETSVSYRLGESGARLHGHIGSGFRAPALYELYGASVFGGTRYDYGNNDLNPEKSLGFDVGAAWKAFDRLQLDLTYFRTDFDELIAFGTTGYENVDGGESQGIEFEIRYAVAENADLTGSYTYTDAKDSDDKDFLGVSEHEIGLTANYRFLEKWEAHAQFTYRSNHEIAVYDPVTYSSVRCTEDGYVNVNAGLDYALFDSLNVWARVENLLDEELTENGFETPGISAYGGIRLQM